jgi:tRNA pseudouridine38-40 synthase
MTQSRNLRLLIAYDGTDFHGWQRQPNALTVQECLESAIERTLGEKAQVYGSGRTDAGVHALNQVANFKTDCLIPCANLVKALNNTLQPAVRIKDVQEVSLRFHARLDARSKTYRYRILQAPVCSPFLWRFVWHYPFPLDIERMAQAAKLFEGEHDFTSFAAVEGSATERRNPNACDPRNEPRRDTETSRVRSIFSSQILRHPRTSMLIYEVTGSGFLHHMVRNIVGTLVEVGGGKLEPGDIIRILDARDRTMAGPTAPAQGLCLVRVEY